MNTHTIRTPTRRRRWFAAAATGLICALLPLSVAAPATANDLATCERMLEAGRPAALHACHDVATASWETNATRVDAYLALGRMLGRLNRFDETLDATRAAIDLAPRDADIFLLETWALLNLNRLIDAREAALTSIRLDGRDASGYLALAFVAANLGLFEEAVAIAARGVGASRPSLQRKMLRVFVAMRDGRDLTTAEHVVRSFANDTVEVRAEANFLLSGVMREQGAFQDAVAALERAIIEGPDTTGKRIALAKLLHEVGQDDVAAAGQLRRALDLGPIPEVAREIRRTLAKMEVQ